jgi:hypothetical protein
MGAPDRKARLASGDIGRMRHFRVAEPLFALSRTVADPAFPVGDGWSAEDANKESLQATGFRLIPGGIGLILKPGRLGFEFELARVVANDSDIGLREALLRHRLDIQRHSHLGVLRAL